MFTVTVRIQLSIVQSVSNSICNILVHSSAKTKLDNLKWPSVATSKTVCIYYKQLCISNNTIMKYFVSSFISVPFFQCFVLLCIGSFLSFNRLLPLSHEFVFNKPQLYHLNLCFLLLTDRSLYFGTLHAMSPLSRCLQSA